MGSLIVALRTTTVVILAGPLMLAATAYQARSQDQTSGDQEVERLFATTCGWCHQDGGRHQGKGPKLMGTTRSDEYIINRIATGRPGRMPAFGQTLTLEQIEAIVRYIRGLKPRDAVVP